MCPTPMKKGAPEEGENPQRAPLRDPLERYRVVKCGLFLYCPIPALGADRFHPAQFVLRRILSVALLDPDRDQTRLVVEQRQVPERPGEAARITDVLELLPAEFHGLLAFMGQRAFAPQLPLGILVVHQ